MRAFEAVADVVHDGGSGAEMVWAPSYGAGYPFERADGRLDDLSPGDLRALDTDADGLLTEADDPYGPYFPDADAVDRVGLTMFYFGKGESGAAAGRDVPLVSNSAPDEGEVAARLDEQWGYTVPQAEAFYDRFASGESRDLLLDTGALYDFSLDGDTELAVKQGWWRQVLAELPDHPRITAVTWLEAVREEAEAGAQEVDWRLTASGELASAFRASGIELPPSVPGGMVIAALGLLGTIFVLIRVISIPDDFSPAGRSIGLWISLLAGLLLIAAGLLRSAEEV